MILVDTSPAGISAQAQGRKAEAMMGLTARGQVVSKDSFAFLFPNLIIDKLNTGA